MKSEVRCDAIVTLFRNLPNKPLDVLGGDGAKEQGSDHGGTNQAGRTEVRALLVQNLVKPCGCSMHLRTYPADHIVAVGLRSEKNQGRSILSSAIILRQEGNGDLTVFHTRRWVR